MINVFRQALHHIPGSRVLDVATAQGGFIGILKESLRSYTEIVGVDVNKHAIASARSTFDEENVCFIQMAGERLGIKEQSFDTVSVAASLHHLANPPQVLAEMARVLKPGGCFIISEMHQDGQTEPQLTAVRIHHWAAAVDSAHGISHYKTLARREIVDLVNSLRLREVVFHDWVNLDSDPMGEALIEQVTSYMDTRLEHIKPSSHTELRRQGEELRRQLHRVGVQREPVLIAIGKK